MKKYLLFAGSDFYPMGGWEDLIGTSDDLNKLAEKARERHRDWYHIVDTETGKVVDHCGSFDNCGDIKCY